MDKTFYISTPIYYVNAAPHIGSLYSTLLADVIVRYMRVEGRNTYFVTGLDEHGQKVAEAACKAEKQPQQFVDDLVPAFKNAWSSWNLAYDFFVRTTDSAHVKAVQEWIVMLQKKGIIYKASYEGWYSVASEAFLTEKDIVECDSDNTPICPISKKRAIWLVEEAYFFKLSSYEKQLLEWYKQHPRWIEPSERMNEVVAFVEQGLKDLCISRSKKSLSWGIPFPGDENHVVYVWADALNNYLTAVGYLQEGQEALFKSCWPCDVHVMGKDIVRFHAVYWPAFLMASGLQLPQTLLVHGWILVDNQKMSKSLGNTVQPEELLKRYGLDRCRYHFVRHMVITHDVSFSYQDLEEKTDAELSNAFGNLVQRVLSMAHTYGFTDFKGTYAWSDAEKHLEIEAKKMLNVVHDAMQSYMLHRAYAHVWEYIGILNTYIHQQQPWVVFKTDKERVRVMLAALLHGIWTVGVMLWPVMPDTAMRLFSLLGMKCGTYVPWTLVDLRHEWNQKFSLSRPEPLFPRIQNEEKKIEGKKAVPEKQEQSAEKKEISPSISMDDLIKVELRVGTITAVDEIPKSDKLYKFTVDFGEQGMRTICSGIREYYTSHDVLGLKTVVAFNLQARMMRGVESQGMIMMAEDTQGKPTLIRVDASVENGTRLK